MKFLKAFQYQIYTIIWGIALILLGIFMWHSLFPIAVGSAFLTLGLTVLLFGNGEARYQDKSSNDG